MYSAGTKVTPWEGRKIIIDDECEIGESEDNEEGSDDYEEELREQVGELPPRIEDMAQDYE